MYRKTVLKNGIRVISERLEHFRSVSLGIWVGVGSRDEMEEESGISHFIEHMIFKGTGRRSSLQIAKELDAIGGLSNAFTGSEYTCFHAKVLDRHLPFLGEILADIFLNSVYDSEEIDRERQVILQEINMVEDTPDEQIHVLFNRLFWEKHPLGRPVLGSAETVSAVGRENLLSHTSRFHSPERILLVAAGNVDHDGLLDSFRPLFESLEPSLRAPVERVAPKTNGGISCHFKELEQVHICLGGEAPYLTSDLRFASAILNTILGGNMSSRLFQEIREKRGLAYSIYSFLSAYIDAGVLGVYLATDPSEVSRALDVIRSEIRKIRSGEISDGDLQATKEHLVGSILLGSESTDSRMMRLAKNEYTFGRYIPYEEVVEELQKVRVDEVIAVAEEVFKEGKVSLVTLGPFKESELNAECLHFR